MATKNASTRRRSVRAVKSLSTDGIEQDGRKLPRLGKREDGDKWHPKVTAWWKEIWTSPVAANFDTTDNLAVWILADMKHHLLNARSNAERVRMGAEVRQMENVLGLNPKARAVQKVELDKADEAERRTRKRRNKTVVAAQNDPDTQVTDPRDALSA